MQSGPAAAELLALADAERDAGRGVAAARLYDEAATAARAGDDLAGWAAAALGAASVQVFGAEPGKLPAVLYDVLARTTDDTLRARLAAALARCWVYASETRRARPFSAEALERARKVGDPALVADALDAALAVNWGPDDLTARQDLTGELNEITAHLVDPQARTQAHLWGLHVACETFDVPAMQRQLRALERLGEESPRARFFAATRRVMLDAMLGRTDALTEQVARAQAAADQVHIPDALMVLGAVQGYASVQSGDLEKVRALCATAEEFAISEGSAVVHAEAAYCWAAVGENERAASLIGIFHHGVLESLPRDVNWLLTVQLVLEVALAIDERDLLVTATELLTPYADRAVVNAGAVWFHGTTDDTLSRALTVLGRDEEAATLRARALLTYQRIGASWWHNRLAATTTTEPAAQATPGGVVRLHPTAGGLWLVGRESSPLPALRGLEYLRELLRVPGRAVPALDLVGVRGPVVEESGVGESIDRQALAAYRDRLRELDAELAEAEEWADPGRIDVARDEREALLAEVGRSTGLGGRTRTTGSSQERARVAVKKAISTAIARVADVDERLGHHLRVSVQTGLTCSYEPEPGAAPYWVLDPES